MGSGVKPGQSGFLQARMICHHDNCKPYCLFSPSSDPTAMPKRPPAHRLKATGTSESPPLRSKATWRKKRRSKATTTAITLPRHLIETSTAPLSQMPINQMNTRVQSRSQSPALLLLLRLLGRRFATPNQAKTKTITTATDTRTEMKSGDSGLLRRVLIEEGVVMERNAAENGNDRAVRWRKSPSTAGSPRRTAAKGRRRRRREETMVRAQVSTSTSVGSTYCHKSQG